VHIGLISKEFLVHLIKEFVVEQGCKLGDELPPPSYLVILA
jgi:hypothetical protein